MRFSSLVSLLVVTASFALGGCAADAEESGETTGTGETALHGSPRVHSDTSVEKAAVNAKDSSRVVAESPLAINQDSDHRANPGLQGATVSGLSAYRSQHTNPGLQGAGIVVAGGNGTIIDPMGGIGANDVALANTNPAVAAGLPGAGSETLDTSDDSTAQARRDP
jgi:hypothetical protein